MISGLRVDARGLALAIYAPTGVSMIGIGAITPLIPLTALALGGSVADAAALVSLVAVGAVVGALPAGALAARFGERRALVAALIVTGAMTALAGFAPNRWLLAAVVFALGLASAVVMIARQSYLTQAVPFRFRARAMSTLGGVFRIGAFLGPLLGAVVVAQWSVLAAYLLAAVLNVAAALLTLVLPDLPEAATPDNEPQPSTWAVLIEHRRAFATVGVGASALMLVRASRDALIPLWSSAHGLDASTTSLVYAAGSAAELLLFYVGGLVMDRYGRRAVAVPTMIVMGTGFLLLPLAVTVPAIAAVSAVLGLGNGISSGVVLTLGADLAPERGRSQFLAGWRLTTGIGQMLGPAAIAGLAAIAPLAWASVGVGAIGWLGAAWLWRWVGPATGTQSSTSSRPRPTISGSGSYTTESSRPS